MVRKRPRGTRPSASDRPRNLRSKMEPTYWRGRLFRNTFTYKGDLRHVNHWSVKIQHLGTRKTFSLQSTDSAEAASEACRLYKVIVTRGWESVSSGGKSKNSEPRPAAEPRAAPGLNGFGTTEYWAQRLIHRKYTESFQSNGDPELSV